MLMIYFLAATQMSLSSGGNQINGLGVEVERKIPSKSSASKRNNLRGFRTLNSVTKVHQLCLLPSN